MNNLSINKSLPVIVLLIFSGCMIYKPTGEYLTGEWTDFTPKEGVMYFAASKLEIKFTRDSFYYHMNKWSDVVNVRDTCQYENEDVYAAGRYMIRQNVLLLSGKWTNGLYNTTNMSLCNDTGKFELVYDVDIQSKNIMELKLKSPLPYSYDPRYRGEMQMVKQK